MYSVTMKCKVNNQIILLTILLFFQLCSSFERTILDNNNYDNQYDNDQKDLSKDIDDHGIKAKNNFGRRHIHLSRKFTDLPDWYGKENFILIDYLTDGEFERRISFNGISAKETSIGYNSSKSLSLWQVSDGLGFLQLIYSSYGELIDCEYIRQKGLVHDFLKKFYYEIDTARSRNYSTGFITENRPPIITDHEFRRYLEDDVIPDDYYDLQQTSPSDNSFALRNLSYHKLEGLSDIPEDTRQWLNFNELKLQCHQRHRQMKKIVQGLNSKDEDEKRNATRHFERKKRDLSDWLIAPNTKWCGRGHNAGTYNQLGGASRADKCCRKHDHCKLFIQGLTTKWQLFNYRPYTISHCSCDKSKGQTICRQRRDLSSLLRVPGTKWCGKGWSADKYSDLGGYSKADRCCRQHDKSCPFWIMGFETKYNLFNWRVSTLMHCKCDERFRTCLKMADSPDANMVGKLFFNIVQTTCFVLKPEKICKKRSWWGKCEKKVLRKRAHIRDNRKF